MEQKSRQMRWVHFVVEATNEAKTSLLLSTYQYAHLLNCSRCHSISSFSRHLHGMWCISSLLTHLGRSWPPPRSHQDRSSWICCQGWHQQTCQVNKGKWGSKLQWQNGQNKQLVKHKRVRRWTVRQAASWLNWPTYLYTNTIAWQWRSQRISTLSNDDQVKLMWWHFCLDHLLFNQIKELAKNGKIPKKLATTKLAQCIGCLFVAITMVQWWTNNSDSGRQVFKTTRSGQSNFCQPNVIMAGNTIPRWSPWSWMGLNLGTRPFHAWSIYLVLNLSTGLVLPNYQCCFNDFLEIRCHKQPHLVTSVSCK